MKRTFAFLLSAAFLLGVAPAQNLQVAVVKPSPSPSPQAKATPKLSKWQLHVLQVMHDAAPGDEYFGRMKMSYLGINNTFRDQAIRAGAYTTDSGIISKVAFADEALQAWSHKYPRDPQLARSFYLGFMMYRKIWTAPAQQHAWQYANQVVRQFPGSFFAKTLRSALKVGFTEHYFASPVPCGVLVSATPVPRGQTPEPTPSPTPTPEPTPTPAPGQPKVEILPVPCLTPTPTPTPLPTATPTPTPTPKGMTPPPVPSAAPSTAASASPTPVASRRPGT